MTAVEGEAPSSALGATAARRQGLRARTVAGDATRTVQRLDAEGQRFDTVVVNPPRSGLSPALRQALGRAAPELLIYVSCEPRSLARDAADLARRRLVPAGLTPVDMMPQSRDVETLTVFRRGDPPPPTVLHRDDRLLVVDAPTDDELDDSRSGFTGRVRALGAAAAVPLWKPSAAVSGIGFFAIDPRFVEELRAELSGREVEYTALVRGIVRTKGTIRRPLGRRADLRDARTRYVRVEVMGGHSLVSARQDTEVEHQLSRHFASLGHPVVGDGRYGHEPTNQFFAKRHLLDRPFLHRARVRWTRAGSLVDVVASLPRDLTIVVDGLRAAGASASDGAPEG